MATGNPHLLGFFDAIWGRALTGLAYHDFYVAMPYEEFIEDHQLLVDEIAKGKPDHARKAMVDHIRRGIERTPILDIDLA
jgi:DNA-binding FadR family transcriptional regulator